MNSFGGLMLLVLVSHSASDSHVANPYHAVHSTPVLHPLPQSFPLMTASYQIDARRSLVRIEYSGPLVPEEIFRVIDELMQDPDLQRGMNVLSDHSEGTSSTIPETIYRVFRRAEKLRERLGPFRCALVVPRDTQFGMANLTSAYGSLYDGIEIRPFRSRAKAEAWLTGEGDSPE